MAKRLRNPFLSELQDYCEAAVRQELPSGEALLNPRRVRAETKKRLGEIARWLHEQYTAADDGHLNFKKTL